MQDQQTRSQHFPDQPYNTLLSFLIPAEFLYQILCTSADFLGEFDDINSFENDVVSPHWVRARERRTEKMSNTQHDCSIVLHQINITFCHFLNFGSQ